MSATSVWRLGCVAACLLAASQPAACGSNNGSAPPVTGGGDDSGGGDDGGGTNGDGSRDGPQQQPDGAGGDGSRDGATPGDAGADHDGSKDGTTPTDGGVDGTEMEAGEEGGLTTDAPPPAPDGGVLCAQGETWGAPVTVLTTASADATEFGSVTPDELTLAWTSSTGGVATIWYADRASTGVAFGAPQQLPSSFGAPTLDRVAVSSDGLRIVGVASGGTTFVAVKRASRSNAFDTDDSAEFSGLTSGEGVKNTYATPLFSPDDSILLYIVTSSMTADVVYESPGGPPWSPGAALGTPQLQRSGTQYRRPTGLSAENLALFYWDETTSSETIGFRATTNTDFNFFVSLGALRNAVPTADCSRIYYSTPATGGAINIVYADGTKPDN